MNGSSPSTAWIQCFCDCAIGIHKVPAGSTPVASACPKACRPETAVSRVIL